MRISVPKIIGIGPINIMPPPFVSTLPLIDLNIKMIIARNIIMTPRKTRKNPVSKIMLLVLLYIITLKHLFRNV